MANDPKPKTPPGSDDGRKPNISPEQLLEAALSREPEPEDEKDDKGKKKYDVKHGDFVEMPGDNDAAAAP